MANKKSQEAQEPAEDVRVEQSTDNAVLLLAAAEEAGADPGVVRTTSDGWFLVPGDIAEKAGVDVIKDEEPEPAPAEEAPAENPEG
jgi:hypothetical protein